jgi:hypothetical protein
VFLPKLKLFVTTTCSSDYKLERLVKLLCLSETNKTNDIYVKQFYVCCRKSTLSEVHL